MAVTTCGRPNVTLEPSFVNRRLPERRSDSDFHIRKRSWYWIDTAYIIFFKPTSWFVFCTFPPVFDRPHFFQRHLEPSQVQTARRSRCGVTLMILTTHLLWKVGEGGCDPRQSCKKPQDILQQSALREIGNYLQKFQREKSSFATIFAWRGWHASCPCPPGPT